MDSLLEGGSQLVEVAEGSQGSQLLGAAVGSLAVGAVVGSQAVGAVVGSQAVGAVVGSQAVGGSQLEGAAGDNLGGEKPHHYTSLICKPRPPFHDVKFLL